MVQQIGVLAVFAKESFEFLAGLGDVACGLPGLCDTNRRAAPAFFILPFAFEPLDELFELIDLSVEGDQLGHHGGLVGEFLRFFIGSPVQLDRLVGSHLIGQCGTESHHEPWFIGIDTNRFAQRLHSLFGFAEPQAGLGIELVVLRFRGRGDDQLLGRVESLRLASQLGFQAGDAGPVIADRTSVHLGQFAEQIRGSAKVPGALSDASRSREGQDRLGIFLDRFVDRRRCVVPFALGFLIPSQPIPVARFRCGICCQLLLDRLGDRFELLARLEYLDAGVKDRLLLFVVGRELFGLIDQLDRFVEASRFVVILGPLEDQSKVFGR